MRATARLAPAGEGVDAGQTPLPVTDNRCWWWARGFPGGTREVGEVRRWVRELLPGCGQLGDAVTIISELAANAVRHTLSARAGFTAEVAWAPGMVRVVVGDRGSPEFAPRVVRDSDGTGSRGLFIVEELSADWGIAGGESGRWVWADVAWPADLAPRPAADDAADSAGHGETSLAATLARRFPRAAPWWGAESRTWWASRPQRPDLPRGLVGAPSPAALGQMLEALYLHAGNSERTGPS